MHVHHIRRQFPLGGGEVRVVRGIDVGRDGLAVRPGKPPLLREGQVGRVRQVRGLTGQRRQLTRCQVQPHHRGLGGRPRRRADHHPVGHGQVRLPHRQIHRDVGDRGTGLVQHRQPPRPQHHVPALPQRGEPPVAQLPHRATQLLLAGRQVAGGPVQADAVQVPPTVRVGQRQQRLRPVPLDLADRLTRATRHHPVRPEHTALADLGHTQLGAVPRHRRVVPADPGRVPTIRADLGTGHEVVAGGEHQHRVLVHGRRARTRQRHQLPPHVGAGRPGDPLPHTPHLAVRPRHEIGVAVPVPHRRLRTDRDRLRRRVVRRDQVHPLIVPVGEGHLVTGAGAHHRPRPAAVLVHPVAHVPRRAQHLPHPAVGVDPRQRDPTPLLGQTLGPPDLPVVQVDPLQPTASSGGVGRADGRGPGSVRSDLHHSGDLIRPNHPSRAGQARFRHATSGHRANRTRFS